MILPECEWGMGTMNFTIGRPTTSGGKNAIWVIVEKLTKLAHFQAIKKTDSDDQLTQIYHQRDCEVTWSSRQH